MSRIILDCAQRTPEWYQARVGRLTASVAADMSAMLKNGKGERSERRDLRTRLALERITGQSGERTFTSEDTERGKSLEDAALAAYEARAGVLLDRVGFVYREDLPIGCSPDGALVDFDRHIIGGVDAKAPRPANHLAYLRDPSALAADYEAQLAHTMLVTGAPWWDVASYCPAFPAPAQLLIVRLVPAGPVAGGGYHADYLARIQAVDLAAHELNVRAFLREVDVEEAAIRQLTDPKEVA